MTGPTASGKLNRLIAQAEEGGLSVRVELRDNDDYPNVESYTVDIEMPVLGPIRTGLDSYHAAHRLHIHAVRWGVGSAKPFKLHVTDWSVTGHRKVKPSMLRWSVQHMAEDLERWIELRAEKAEAES